MFVRISVNKMCFFHVFLYTIYNLHNAVGDKNTIGFLQIKVVNEAGLETFASSPGVFLDPTPPVPKRIISLDPEFDMTMIATHQGHTDSLAARWEFDEPESHIMRYRVAVGKMPNGTEILDWLDVGLEQNMMLSDLGLENLATYFFTVEATNAAGLSSVEHTEGITVSINLSIVLA